MSLPSFWSKLGNAISGVTVAADSVATTYREIDNTITSANHMMQVGKQLVQRDAQAEGISQVQAAANLVQRGDAALTGWDAISKNRNSLTFILFAIGAVLLLFLLLRKG